MAIPPYPPERPWDPKLLGPRIAKSVLERFWSSSKHASKFASKKCPNKCEIWGFWPPKTFPKPFPNPTKIVVPKNTQIFTDFCMIFVACCKSQHQKNVRPRSVLLAFHTIQLFALGMALRRLSSKNEKLFDAAISVPQNPQCCPIFRVLSLPWPLLI